MPRKKGKAKAKGGPKPAPRPPHKTTSSRLAKRERHYRPDEQDPGSNLSKFSLNDEARWMSNHRSHAFNSDRKLRHLPVVFVSAGCLEGTIKEKELPPAIMPPESPINTEAMAQMTIASPSRPSRPSSPSSTSSDEVVFQGRNTASTSRASAKTETPSKPAPAPVRKKPEPAPARKEPGPEPVPARAVEHDARDHPAAQSEPKKSQIQVPPSERAVPGHTVLSSLSQSKALSCHAEDEYADANAESVNNDGFKKRLAGQSPWLTNTTTWVSRSNPGIGWLPLEDRPDMHAFLPGEATNNTSAMDDYMENGREEILATFGAASSFAHRPLDLGEDVYLPSSSKQPKHDYFGGNGDTSDAAEAADAADSGWNSDMLRDLDDLSTSSDREDIVDRILLRRHRTSGVQYLVVYQGSMPDDVHWLPSSFFNTKQDLELIRAWEAENLTNERQGTDSDDSEISNLNFENSDDSNTEEDLEDQEDDERIAQILQQDEYGLDADDFFIDLCGEGASGAVRIDRPCGRRQQRNLNRKSQPSFPSASAMADALEADPYGGFDVMDHERPSLRPVKKGRRGRMPPELYDSDLNEKLQSAWAADRLNKKMRRAEREERRKQESDTAISMDGIIDMLRDFMFSDRQQMPLPPMEKFRRAIVHQIVGQMGVNSKSVGNGDNRHTILSKTKRIKKVDDAFFDAIRHRRGFQHRFDGPAARGGGGGGKGKTTRRGVSYKDGETVGASAPELGPENKGRRLLEKMGWTKGTALGALDNKGILLPISHTVKMTKAGLQ